jgi:hypothetical protein
VNQLNNIDTDNNETKPVEPVALEDCGQASKVTKGTPFVYYYEAGSPPFDRSLIGW